METYHPIRTVTILLNRWSQKFVGASVLNVGVKYYFQRRIQDFPEGTPTPKAGLCCNFCAFLRVPGGPIPLDPLMTLAIFFNKTAYK